MLSAIGIAGLMDIVVNTATAVVRPWTEILAEDWATGAAVKDVLGNFGLFFVGVAMLCAVLSGMNAFLLSASRLFYAMSTLDAMPTWFGKLDEKTAVPKNAILFLTVLSLAAPFLGRQVINWVVDMTSVGASLSFAYSCAAAMKLAKRCGEKKWFLSGAAGLLLSVFFLGLLLIPGAPGFLSSPSLIALAAWTAFGIVIFRIVGKKFMASPALDQMLSRQMKEK